MAKLHDYYKDEVVTKLMSEFNYNSVMQVPRVEKITLNAAGEPTGTVPVEGL